MVTYQSVILATQALATISAVALVVVTFLYVSAANAMVSEMRKDREERHKPHLYLQFHAATGFQHLDVDFPVFVHVGMLDKGASLRKKKDGQQYIYNYVIVRNVGTGQTGPGQVFNISYECPEPDTVIEDDVADFEIRSILPGEAWGKIFAIQKPGARLPKVKFTYKCAKVEQEISYPPPGKTDFFVEIFPATNVRIMKDQVNEKLDK